jgi:predicted GIY-YIG superfamily endonuclease
MKPGYLYILTHPSDPELYKIGVTVIPVEKRLAQHNSQLEKAAGKVVKETGQKWVLKTFIEVADPYHAESAFWGATWVADIPYRGGVEIWKMDWPTVERALAAAQRAGTRPPPPPREYPVRNADWMVAQLEGTGIKMLGRYSGLVRGMEFQCEHGHVFRDSPALLASKKSCPCCVDWGFPSGYRAGVRMTIR